MRRRFPPPILTASLAAGPIFVVSTGVAAAYLRSPGSMVTTIDPSQIAALVMISVPAILFGFLLSIIPNLIGTAFLLIVGFEFHAARSPIAWIGTGALFGAAIAWLTGGLGEPAAPFGLIFTSACCAAICRRSARWE